MMLLRIDKSILQTSDLLTKAGAKHCVSMEYKMNCSDEKWLPLVPRTRTRICSWKRKA